MKLCHIFHHDRHDFLFRFFHLDSTDVFSHSGLVVNNGLLSNLTCGIYRETTEYECNSFFQI